MKSPRWSLLLLTCLAGVNGLNSFVVRNPRDGKDVTYKRCDATSWVKKTYIDRRANQLCYPNDDDPNDKWVPNYSGCYCANYQPLSRYKLTERNVSLQECAALALINESCTHEFWHNFYKQGDQARYHYVSDRKTGLFDPQYGPDYSCGCVRQEPIEDPADNTKLVQKGCTIGSRRFYWTFECCEKPAQRHPECDPLTGLQPKKDDEGNNIGKCIRHETLQTDQKTNTCAKLTETECPMDAACIWQYEHTGCCTDPNDLTVPRVSKPCEAMYMDFENSTPGNSVYDDQGCKADADCAWNEKTKRCYLASEMSCSRRKSEKICTKEVDGVIPNCNWLPNSEDCVCLDNCEGQEGMLNW